jgi:hypothetical protein
MNRLLWAVVLTCAARAAADELTVVAEKKWQHRDFAGVGLGHAVCTRPADHVLDG